MSDTVYQIITDRIVGLLEKGVVPWQQTWKGRLGIPRNLGTKKTYEGVNLFLLASMGYQSPFWLTFKQAIKLGGNVRKGEKACPVVFWKILEDKTDGAKEPKKRPLLRYYSVFNVAQCEQIAYLVPDIASVDRPACLIAKPEQLVERMSQRPPIKHGLAQAFYSPREDFVGMPTRRSFASDEHYYGVLFHELTHATGHQSRLNRATLTEKAGFGTDSYAKEELIAEMGSAFLCAHAEIVERTIENSAAYLNGWLQRLKGDCKLVVHAAAAAQKAADFITGKPKLVGVESEAHP